MKKIILYTVSLFMIVACGGSDGGSNSTFSGQMVVSENYTVFSGDSVVKGSDNALIRIIHQDGEDKSTIELIEGNVTILRKS